MVLVGGDGREGVMGVCVAPAGPLIQRQHASWWLLQAGSMCTCITPAGACAQALALCTVACNVQVKGCSVHVYSSMYVCACVRARGQV